MASSSSNPLQLAPGQKVELNDGRTATVRFFGPTNFQTGEWVGVELEDGSGKNDGSVKGDRYFECEMGFGMFLKPTGVRRVVEGGGVKRNGTAVGGGAGAGTRSRPTSGILASGVKRQSLVGGAGASSAAAASKRESLYGASPTPAGRVGSAARTTTAGVQSPTKRVGANGAAGSAASRTGTPSTTAVGRKPAVSSATARSSRPSLAPPASSASAASRRASTLHSSSAGSAATPRTARPSIAPSTRVPPGRSTATAARSTPGVPSRAAPRAATTATTAARRQGSVVSSQEANEDVASEATEEGLPLQEQEDSPTADRSEDRREDGEDEEEQEMPKPNFAPPPIPPDPPERTTRSRRPSSPAASTVSGRTIRSSAASAKQIEELEAKVRLLERKRQEDRDIKNALERTQQERDKYQSIIEKLQTKYQPQQRENEELKKQLEETEKRFAEVENTQAEHDSIIEMATLDREMAEETAEALKADLEALRLRHEEIELEVEVLREENDELSKEMSPEERTSTGWLQMEKSNERLREALLRLRDVTQDQEAELREEIKSLEGQVRQFDEVQGQFENTKEKLLRSEADTEDLRQQLDAALGAEDMIEELTERNMTLQEKIDDLRDTVSELEDLRELNDELEINHVEAEKQMQEEIDFKDSLLLDRERVARQQQESLDDADYTINRFRDLVSQLQNDLQDMQASKQISETEAADLQSRSRAMIDLNMKLQSSAAKTQVKAIDLELRRLDAQEASEHLAIVQLFLPEAFHAERDSVLALLRFKRIGFKAQLIHGFVRDRTASFGMRGQDENIFAACDVMDKLTWIVAMSSRFVNAVCGCTVEEFAGFESALYELEPVERALNGYVDALRREDLRENTMAEELQRSIAVMSHLGSLHIHEGLASHADDLLMRTVCLQSQLESTAAALDVIHGLVEARVAGPAAEDDEDEDGIISDRALILNRAAALVQHVRNAKVMAQKTHRSLNDLLDRSLTLEDGCTESFESAASISTSVATYVRQAGEELKAMFDDDTRSGTFVPSEVASALSRAATVVFQLPAADAGPFNSLADRVRDLTSMLIDIASLPTDLDNTVEFERAPAPWVARATELKQTKITSIDTEAELIRALESVKGRDVMLREKETELEEQSVRIEMLEARMKDAGKRSAKIAELERDLHRAVDNEQQARQELSHVKRDAQHDVDRIRDEMGRLAEQRAREGAGGKLNDDAMGAAARLSMARLQHTVTSLQGAIRHLSEENSRLRLPPPDAPASLHTKLDWLHAPLVPPSSERRLRKDALMKEGKDLLAGILHFASKPQTIVDLTKLPPAEDRLKWRPKKDSSRWKVERRREEWERWKGWRKDLVVLAKNPAGALLPPSPAETRHSHFINDTLFANGGSVRLLGDDLFDKIDQSVREIKVVEPEEQDGVNGIADAESGSFASSAPSEV
ncbi:hypothetical protein K431DRAFT_282405 [Polychaeton citri CBS 116435]|uniref:CAP-Gly domain-containing protein n=1 Tax=Polychaeton citri CBS 116435 TaxID=1314669 RepID=A0A9P4UTI7_9PEZI|nr:hypothetical protein K431DRAFT_282405 [Polychaeton citri CBS 116435]